MPTTTAQGYPMSEENLTKQRLPSGSACASCRKKKNRCDGARPKCSGCRSRGIPCDYPSVLASQLSVEELKAFIEAKLRNRNSRTPTSPGHQLGLHDVADAQRRRLSSFEQSVEPMGIDALLRASTDVLGPCNDALEMRALQNVGVDRSTGSAQQDRQTSEETALPESPESEGFFGDSSSFAFVSKVVPDASDDGEQNPQRKKRRISTLPQSRGHAMGRDLGLTCQEWEACFDLPNRTLADSLVDAYFNRVQHLYPFVFETSFRVDYERIWLYPRESLHDLQPEWFAILNMIFANGCEFCNAIHREELLSTASNFITRARRLIRSRVFQSSSFEMVQGLLLMCHYLQGTLELSECWNLVGLMIRTAIAVGLHLNPTAAMKPVEREIRKRVWWGCIAIDRTLSMKFGRPPSFKGHQITNVDLPTVIDDQYITNQTLNLRQPEGKPSLMEFFVQTIKMSPIIDNVLSDLYQPEESPEKDCIRGNGAPHASRISHILGCAVHLDGKVLSWWHAIPSHLKTEPDIPDGPDFQRQRNVLYLRFLNLRLLLHRQALLIFCRHDIDDPFQRDVAISSSRESIACARESVRFIHAQYPRGLLNALTYILHVVFTSMGVLLSVQTMDQARLDALNQSYEEEILECGMEFLKAASSASTLAAKYVAMLERFQSPPKRYHTKLVSGDSRETLATAHDVNTIDEPLMFTNDATWPAGMQDESDGMRFQPSLDADFVDFNDLLSGTGLPRDFISGQGLNFDAFY